MSDSFYHITESSELNKKKHMVQNILIWPCTSAMFWNFCLGIHMYSASTMTSLNVISHMCETRNFVMAIKQWKQVLLCDKKCYSAEFNLLIILQRRSFKHCRKRRKGW